MSKEKLAEKTKSQIEKDSPIIKPSDCPGAIINWVQERDEDNFIKWREMLREELKPIKRFMKIASGNRIWLIVLSGVVMVLAFIVFYHITK